MEKLNQHVYMIYEAIQDNNIKSVQSIINRSKEFCSIFLGTIRGTNQYQALYNHIHYFQTTLNDLNQSVENGNYNVENDNNVKRVKFIFTHPKFKLISEYYNIL